MATDPRLVIWRTLLQGQRSMTLRLTAALKTEFGLSTAQFEALRNLTEAPDHALPATELARTLLYSSGSASHLISRLESSGWVTRTPDRHDSRVVNVALTAAGLDLITRARDHHIADLTAQFSPLIADDELSAVLAFAQRLADCEGLPTD